MAQQDYAGLLTGLDTRPINPMQGLDREGRMAQRATGFANRMTGGLLTAAGQERATPQQQANKAIGSLNLDTNDPVEQEKNVSVIQAVDPQRAAQLRQMYTQKNTQETATDSLATWVDDKYGVHYGNLVRDKVMNESNMKNFIPELSNAGGSRYGKGTSMLGRDTEGNTYNMTTSFDKKKGGLTTVYSPISQGAPETPVGKVTVVSSDFAQTSSEEVQSAIDKASGVHTVRNFADMKGAASDEFAKAGEALTTGNRMLEILTDIETGGMTPIVLKAITDVFGVTPTSIAEFDNLAGQMMLASLKAFGANPTEGERAVAATLQASIDKGEGVNKAIIEKFVKEQLRKKSRLQYLLHVNTKDLDSYNSYVLSQYRDDEKEATDADDSNTIDFNNLPEKG